MVSLFGRGFDSLQLHFVAPSRGLTLVRVEFYSTFSRHGIADASIAMLIWLIENVLSPLRFESGKAERDSLQLHLSIIPMRSKDLMGMFLIGLIGIMGLIGLISIMGRMGFIIAYHAHSAH